MKHFPAQGDLVRKVDGSYCLGKVNSNGYLLVSVFSNNKIKIWPGHLVEVINESGR